jgi:hypothetical protein
MSDLLHEVASRFAIDDVVSSPTMTISGEAIDAFNRGTWLDLAYPGPDPDEYGDDVVPGFMTLSLLDALAIFASKRIGSAPFKGSYTVNYGLGRVRFVRMVHAGDAVSAAFAVRSVVARGDGVLVTRDCTLYVEPEHEVALVAEWLSLHVPADPRAVGATPVEG